MTRNESVTDAIQQTQFAAQTAHADGHHVAEARGEYKGQTVTHSPASTLSMIQDAAEELTFTQSETVSKKLADRKAKSRHGGSAAVELAEKYLQSIPDIGQPEKLQQLAESLKKLAQATPEQVREQLEGFFGDVSHQFAGLSFTEELLTAEGGHEELLAAVRAVKAELETNHGPEIRAGFNVSHTAADFADGGLGDIQELRDFYRESVLGYEGVTQAYDGILSRYGADRFGDATDFLIKSIGNDVQASGPSLDPRQLKATLDDLYFVQVARNTHEQFGTLLETLNTQFGVGGDADPHELMQEILPLKDQRWVDASKITSLVDRLGITGDEEKIYCLRELHGIVRKLPVKVFNDSEDRTRLATAVQEALDIAIDEEAI